MSEFRKVTFQGHKLWLGNSYEEEGHAPLALEYQVVDGFLDIERCFDEPSFAHVFDADVFQKHKRIGSFSDLVEGWAD